MSMAAMVRDMRSRFLVALVFAILIAIWSPIGRSLFGSTPPTPFGMRDHVWELLLSLPVIFYSSTIFFVGAWKALERIVAVGGEVVTPALPRRPTLQA
jgi:P-type Cu2+ transporter